MSRRGRAAIALVISFASYGAVACTTAPAPAVPPPMAAGPAPSAAAPESSPDAGPAAVSAVSREQSLIARMLRRVEAVRGFEARQPVPGVVLDRAGLLARVKQHLDAELPPEAIRDEGLALQLFGFVPTAYDYEAAEYDLLGDQLAGYYEPADRTMYMAGDLAGPEAEATLAHELVHALQDQRWDLGARCKYQPGAGDRSEAVSALAEGDATSAMFDVLVAQTPGGQTRSALDVPDDVFAAQIREGMEQGPGANAPRIMRSSLAAPYIYGTLFVNALRRHGGWAEVNRAWDDAPVTTEQILHVDKWRAHEGPLAIAAPPYAVLGPGWSVNDDDSDGELGTRLAFEEWLDANSAASLAAGWGGDRGVLLAHDDLVAYAWRLRYDVAGAGAPKRAQVAFKALERAIEKEGHFTESDGSFACRARPDRGPLSLAISGDDLIFTLGPARVKGGAWASAGDCALARRWSRSITATK